MQTSAGCVIPHSSHRKLFLTQYIADLAQILRYRPTAIREFRHQVLATLSELTPNDTLHTVVLATHGGILPTSLAITLLVADCSSGQAKYHQAVGPFQLKIDEALAPAWVELVVHRTLEYMQTHPDYRQASPPPPMRELKSALTSPHWQWELDGSVRIARRTECRGVPL